MTYLSEFKIGRWNPRQRVPGPNLAVLKNCGSTRQDRTAAPAVTARATAPITHRGRLTAQVREQQLAPALAMKPDMATIVAGMNDLLRPRFNARSVAADLRAMFAALIAAVARSSRQRRTVPRIVSAPRAQPLRA
jgi:lysophospholipase L1-like esterase